MFPIESAGLEGLRILLMIIPLSNPREVTFVGGVVEYDGDAISLRNLRGESRLTVIPTAPPRGFDPRVLRDVLRPRAYSAVLPLSANIDAAVAVFSASTAPPGLTVEDALYGLGQAASGAPLLFQGDPSLDVEDVKS